MNIERLRIKIEETIYEWAVESNLAEANSPLRASSEQSVVGPPDVVDSENPALARPASLAELKTLIKKKLLIEEHQLWKHGDLDVGKHLAGEMIIQWIEDLDQGPIASSQTVDEWSNQKSCCWSKVKEG